MKDRAIPAPAATRDHKPMRVAAPTASSPSAMRTPERDRRVLTRWATSAWIGLRRAAEANWAWIDVGFDESKKPGLASFWRPAKTKVPPRKSRRGSSAHPAMDVARGGGPRRAQTWRTGGPRCGPGRTSALVCCRCVTRPIILSRPSPRRASAPGAKR